MCFTLWQGCFSAIVESRAAASHVTHYLMTQWRVRGERKTLSLQGSCFSFTSLSGFHSQPMGVLFLPTLFLASAVIVTLIFLESQLANTLQQTLGMILEIQTQFEIIEQEFGARSKARVKLVKSFIT